MNFNPGRAGFDPTYQDINGILFKDQSKVIDQWREFFPKSMDPLPHGMPEPLGKTVSIICYVDENHAGDILNKK